MSDSLMAVTASYERWRAQRTRMVMEDIARKHEQLAVSPFVLLRGTYYRFLEQFGGLLPALALAPRVVAVGDLHIENFGTWRDREGRLAWGVNDFDELDVLPYTVDLVRLATSALLAIRASHLALHPRAATEAILKGWRSRIERGQPLPFVLAEQHPHLQKLAAEAFVPPGRFARQMRALPAYEGGLPKPAARLLAQVAPAPDFEPALRRRTAGVGSLGSLRIVALAELDGGLVVREAKQIPGSARLWLQPTSKRERGLPKAVSISRSVAAEPTRRQSGRWTVRRLAPDVTRLELAALRRKHDEAAILRDMGAEAANIHMTADRRAASPEALGSDAGARADGWLREAAAAMAAATERDYRQWCKAQAAAHPDAAVR